MPAAPPSGAKDQVLDQDLAHQTPSPGTDRRTHGDLAAPGKHPRRQQVGRVDAPDQQHRGSRREEQQSVGRERLASCACSGIDRAAYSPRLARDGTQKFRLHDIEFLLRADDGTRLAQDARAPG